MLSVKHKKMLYTLLVIESLDRSIDSQKRAKLWLEVNYRGKN